MTIPQALDLAIQHHQAGRLADAETLYHQILTAQPHHADALHLLGVLAHQTGHHALAVERIRQSLAINPTHPGAHSNLGEAYRAAGHLDEAIASFRQALHLQPHYPAAHNNLGNALNKKGELDAAITEYRRALELQPNYPEAHNNLGIALAAQNRLDEAVAAYHHALALRPDYAEAHNNLSNALREQGLFEEAAAASRRALELKPHYPKAYNNLGIALVGLSQFVAATDAFRHALTLQPDYAEAHLNLGVALAKRGRFDEAAAAYRQTLALQPDCAEAHNNLANALRNLGQCDEALVAGRRALALKPGYAEAHLNLGNVHKDQGRLDEAIAEYRRALDLQPDASGLHSNLIYTLHLHSGYDTAAIAMEHARWNRKFSEPQKRFILPHRNTPDPQRRLKIGYVSPDFRGHAVSFFLTPLLEAHDHRSCKIYCYADIERPDALTERLRKTADVWQETHTLSDAQFAERVRADGIDILVDLAMHTADNRLPAFARKPAPIEVSWLAYPGTTGLEAIDYRLTDAHIDPPKNAGALPEEQIPPISPLSPNQNNPIVGGQPFRLPDAWCCYAPIAEFPLVGPLPATQTGIVTFGSLNRFDKIHEALLQCWAKLLATVPASRLLLVCPESQARKRTQAIFATHGIAPERLEFVTLCPWPEYIRLFERIDIALDAYPCNGMTTTCHALWMGVPVITRTGTSPVSRAGSSLLHTIGLPEWVAENEEQYLHIATASATDLPHLAELRATLRPRMQASPLMDAPRFARNVEAAYRAMWHRWCSDQAILNDRAKQHSVA